MRTHEDLRAQVRSRLLADPDSIKGAQFTRQFRDGHLWRPFDGIVDTTYVVNGTQQWYCMYDDGDAEDLTIDQIMHHVVDGYSSLPTWKTAD